MPRLPPLKPLEPLPLPDDDDTTEPGTNDTEPADDTPTETVPDDEPVDPPVA